MANCTSIGRRPYLLLLRYAHRAEHYKPVARGNPPPPPPPPPPLKGSRSAYVVRVPACEASGLDANCPPSSPPKTFRNGPDANGPPFTFRISDLKWTAHPPFSYRATHLGHRPLVRSTFVFRTPPFPDLATGLHYPLPNIPYATKIT